MDKLHQELYKDGQLDEQQYMLLDSIESRKVISLYYELRLVLYLGILLLTGGVGYIVYNNLGEIGHYLVMTLLLVGIGAGGYFVHLKAKPYANDEVKVDHIYFDYLLLLVALLIISLFTYIQVYFDLLEMLIKWTSLVSSLLFFTLAYRYDNKMVLSLGITALAAVFGLTVSPVNWIEGQWLEGGNIYYLSVVFGVFLYIVGVMTNFKNIKKHFTFTYHHFALLLIYFGGLGVVFDSGEYAGKASLLLVVALGFSIYTWQAKKFLFFLYSSIVAYIAVTILFVMMESEWEFYLFYFPVTCISGVILLVKNKKHFSND